MILFSITFIFLIFFSLNLILSYNTLYIILSLICIFVISFIFFFIFLVLFNFFNFQFVFDFVDPFINLSIKNFILLILNLFYKPILCEGSVDLINVMEKVNKPSTKAEVLLPTLFVVGSLTLSCVMYHFLSKEVSCISKTDTSLQASDPSSREVLYFTLRDLMLSTYDGQNYEHKYQFLLDEVKRGLKHDYNIPPYFIEAFRYLGGVNGFLMPEVPEIGLTWANFTKGNFYRSPDNHHLLIKECFLRLPFKFDIMTRQIIGLCYKQSWLDIPVWEKITSEEARVLRINIQAVAEPVSTAVCNYFPYIFFFSTGSLVLVGCFVLSSNYFHKFSLYNYNVKFTGDW